MALIVAATTAFALCGGDIQPQRPGIIPELPAFSPTIRLWPAAARTFPRDRLAFHASGTDTRNAPALRWSLIGDGQISADGVYTAPSGAGGAQVIAAEGRVAAAAHIAVRAPPPPQRPLLIVSCYDDGALDVLDAKTLAQIGSFSAGRDAAGIAVDQRRRYRRRRT
ncbi:MAG: hypothetical protein GIW99_06270, partial [Candidatus Eremiobacteraeota bacterium]|nr:hypothetical protein [Candidatus Eremiobacteraeota bacterium]